MFDDTSSYNVTEMQRLTASAGIFPLLAFLGDPNSGAPKWNGLLKWKRSIICGSLGQINAYPNDPKYLR
jgi:hypothetical protein